MRLIFLAITASISIGFASAADKPIEQVADNVTVHDTNLSSFLSAVLGEPKDVRRKVSDETLATAEDALEENPSSREYRILQVAALGSLARTLGTGESITGRYGSRSKDAVNKLMDLTPDDPTAKALAGVWHLEVIRRGGSAGAFMLGASLEDGETLLKEALEASPEDPIIAFSYGVTILSLNPSKYGEEAKALLQNAKELSLHKDSAIHIKILTQSEKLLKLLDAGFVDEAGNYAVESM